MVFEIVCGHDEVEINNEKKKFIKKYYTDDLNFTEIANSELCEENIKAAISSVPMFAKNYLVVLEMDKNTFSKYAALLAPHDMIVLLVVLRGHLLSDSAVSDAVTLKAFPKPTRKDFISYAGVCGKEYDIELNMDERKTIADLFPDKNSICKIVFQLSLLPAFDRRSFLMAQADTKRLYKWEIIAALSKRDIKAFAKEYYSAASSFGMSTGEAAKGVSEQDHMRVLTMIANMLDGLLDGSVSAPEFIQSRADAVLSNPSLQSYLSYAVWDVIAQIRAGQFYTDPIEHGLTVFIIQQFNDIIQNMKFIT